MFWERSQRRVSFDVVDLMFIGDDRDLIVMIIAYLILYILLLVFDLIVFIIMIQKVVSIGLARTCI